AGIGKAIRITHQCLVQRSEHIVDPLRGLLSIDEGRAHTWFDSLCIHIPEYSYLVADLPRDFQALLIVESRAQLVMRRDIVREHLKHLINDGCAILERLSKLLIQPRPLELVGHRGRELPYGREGWRCDAGQVADDP